MNNKSKPAGRPAPDENRIEEILSNIQPVPGDGFRQRMQRAPWQAARIQQGKITMKTKFALSALAVLLVFAATVAFVPPVRAQVSEWFSITFQDPNGSGSFGVAGSEPMSYQVMQPGYLPQILSNNTVHAWFGETSEVVYKADDQFLVITQTEAVDGESLPDGEAVMINGRTAVLNKGLSGTYQEGPEGMSKPFVELGTDQETPEDATHGGGIVTDQGNGTPQSIIVDQVGPANDFITFDYTDAAKLTFMIGNTKIEMLSNLSLDELLKIAESLIPAK